MTAPALLVAEDLDKEYRSGPELVRVLRGASLAIRRGEMVALVGASGVGKSTLLHLLGALDRPTAGRVLWEGEDLFGRPESGLVRYRRHEVGFVFQFYNLLGLGDRVDHRPGELSGGEQQRVAIARALVNAPKLILADEPTGNLDPKTSEVIYDLFLRLQAERGIAFLVATHNPDLARRAERGYRLVEGRAREIE
jgi:lipoprotein-releasing system ATP-binding protein